MIFLKVVCALLIFGLIILIHEFGHFIVARLFGVTVNEFSFGMGPRLFSVQGKQTKYSLKLLPIGGSCEMKGEMEDTTGDEDCFINKAPWKRLLIILAGPVFNFLLSFLVAFILVIALGSDRPLVASVMDGFPAQEAGIETGDEIIRINGRNIRLYREISLYNALHEGVTQNITVKRNGEKLNFVIKPEYDDEYGRYLLGIVADSNDVFPANVFDVIRYGYYEVRYNFLVAVDSLCYIFGGHLSRDSVMGPVGIVGQITDTVEEVAPMGARVLILTMIDYLLLFGTNLGVMNLLPFPALDGGRIVFILFEMIFKKPVKREVEGYIHLAGFAALMILMVLIAWNDVGRLMR